MDIRVAGQTVDNIRDAFQTLLRTSYHFQTSGGNETKEEQEDVKFFLKCSMETFTDWGTQLQRTADFFQTDQSKFYENLSLEGERIG
jgi:queuine/archaeosine tRNA-ribosyltransferase